MSLLDRVLCHLEGKEVASALIGGLALAAYGVSRATEDIDLLVLDRDVLAQGFWDWEESAEIDIRRGDLDDPLAGVVRIQEAGEIVDLVVGREPWMKGVLKQRIKVQVGPRVLAVVPRADLVLLKLFAGGPQDLLDIELLLAADTGGLKAEVEQRLERRSGALVKTWKRVLGRSASDPSP